MIWITTAAPPNPPAALQEAQNRLKNFDMQLMMVELITRMIARGEGVVGVVVKKKGAAVAVPRGAAHMAVP